MTDWAKAVNPTAPISTEDEALGAARVSTIAIALGAAWGIVGVVQMTANKARLIELATTASAGNPAAGPEMAATIVQGTIYFGIAMVVIQVILALVQWIKPNIIIPIIFLILVAGGAVMSLIQLATNPVAMSSTPIWQMGLSYVIVVVQLVLHTSGIRGASKLDKIRYEAANTFDN